MVEEVTCHLLGGEQGLPMGVAFGEKVRDLAFEDVAKPGLGVNARAVGERGGDLAAPNHGDERRASDAQDDLEVPSTDPLAGLSVDEKAICCVPLLIGYEWVRCACLVRGRGN